VCDRVEINEESSVVLKEYRQMSLVRPSACVECSTFVLNRGLSDAFSRTSSFRSHFAVSCAPLIFIALPERRLCNCASDLL
jgi:hypothetical protein